MSTKICRKCGGTTNTAVCDWMNSADDKADGCYLRWVNNRWEQGCSFSEMDRYTKASVDNILMVQNKKEQAEIASSPFDWPFAREPDSVNEKGVKWWIDKSSTDYARNPDSFGTCLPEVTCWFVEVPSGEKTRLITDGTGVIYESQQLEAIGVYIDMLKMDKAFPKKEGHDDEE